MRKKTVAFVFATVFDDFIPTSLDRASLEVVGYGQPDFRSGYLEAVLGDGDEEDGPRALG